MSHDEVKAAVRRAVERALRFPNGHPPHEWEIDRAAEIITTELSVHQPDVQQLGAMAALAKFTKHDFDCNVVCDTGEGDKCSCGLDAAKAAALAAPDVQAAERCQHLAERDELGEAIAQAAIRAGIIDGKHPLSGPQLVMLCYDLAAAAFAASPVVDEVSSR